jgi:hypothetical protein
LNRLLYIALLPLLAAALLFAGCDSNDDDTPDSERIVGTWQASEARVNTPVPGVHISVLDASNADQVTLAFGADGRYALVVDGALEVEVPQVGQTITIPGGTREGTYALVQDQKVRFTTDGVTGSIAVDYGFRGANELNLTVENTEEGRQVIALILGLEADSPILNLIAGGTLSLRRSS